MKSFRYTPRGPCVIRVSGAKQRTSSPVYTRTLGHRSVQCSLTTGLMIIRNWTHNQDFHSCSFNSGTNFKNRNNWLSLHNPGHLDIWKHLKSLHLESGKLISVCASQISANSNISFPRVLLI